MSELSEAIKKADNKVKSIETLLLTSTIVELELMRELAEGNAATASVNDLQLEETFYNDLEELMANIVAEKLILRSMK
ncbi:hypothetical protein LCGC14_2789520 [marine sediment metagenome]|uniref:Uncharacterized protein n=1 Tax=marine sediment metagenome TaxID=412755 RepID=A0A0F9AZK7_9ZZZZ